MQRSTEISRAGAASVPDLRPVFLALHEDHRGVSAIALTDPEDRAWSERAATYRARFDAGQALLHVARDRDGCVGYAFTILHEGNDDTFPLSPRYAELYTLAVLPAWRGSGVGSALCDAVDRDLLDAGIANLTVAVMVGNEAALRFYRRRGLVPGEVVLYRLG